MDVRSFRLKEEPQWGSGDTAGSGYPTLLRFVVVVLFYFSSSEYNLKGR